MAQDWCSYFNSFSCQVAAAVVAGLILMAAPKWKEFYVKAMAETVSDSVMLTHSDVASMLQISPRKLDFMIRDCEIPAPVALGKRSKRFRRIDIERWIEAGCPKQKPARKK